MQPQLSKAANELRAYPSKSISRQTTGAKNRIDLSFGQPWFGPPPIVHDHWESFKKAATNRYADSAGARQLRSKIADRYRVAHDLNTDVDHVLVTQGASSAFMLAVLTTTEPGDAVMVPDPGYTLYSASLRLLGRRPIPYRRSIANGYSVLRAIQLADVDNARVLVINSPENPTGYVCDPEEMRSVVEHCEERGMFLLHDEVYGDFVFDGGRHTPAAAVAGESANSPNVVQLNSFSKRFGMPSLRIGWIHAHPDVISAAAKAQDYLTMSVSPIAERIAEKIMTDQTIWSWVGEQRAELERRRDLTWKFVEEYRDIFQPSLRPAGAMFAFINVRRVAAALMTRDSEVPSIDAGTLVAERLHSEYGVAAVPGLVYGSTGSEYIRLVTAVDLQDLKDGLGRLGSFVHDLALT